MSSVITGHPAYPPVAWEATGKIVGAGPELVTGIARKLGVKKITSQDFGSWGKAIDAARDGRADVVLGIYTTDERAKFLPQGMPASDMYVAFSKKSPCAAGMKAAVDGGEVKALLDLARRGPALR